MKKKIVLTCSLLMGLGLTSIPPGRAGRPHPVKTYTIAERETMLEKKIENAYNEGEVTLLHQSNDLRGRLQIIRNKEQKMKDANGGKLSSGDKVALEKELNQLNAKVYLFVRRFTNWK